MFHFTTQGDKSRHIKRNNCKPKSIIHAINNNNINNITNNNTIIINNYGNERLDYFNDEFMYKLLINDNSIRNYIENKHFNKEFPENQNIK